MVRENAKLLYVNCKTDARAKSIRNCELDADDYFKKHETPSRSTSNSKIEKTSPVQTRDKI